MRLRDRVDMWDGNKEQAVFEDLPYHGDSQSMEVALVETICRLPDKVAEYALERCVFLSVGGVNNGQVLPAGIVTGGGHRRRTTRGVWIVILSETIGLDDIHSVIAHEIAHAYLKHDRYDPDLPQGCELAAAALAAEWGFSGIGADPEYCDAPFKSVREFNNRRVEPGWNLEGDPNV